VRNSGDALVSPLVRPIRPKKCQVPGLKLILQAAASTTIGEMLAFPQKVIALQTEKSSP